MSKNEDIEFEKMQATQELRAIEEEEVRRMMDEKYRYYEPNGVIEDFINAFASNDYFILFLSSANGVGKTAAAVNILAHLMYPTDSKWFRGELFHKFPYLTKGRIVTESALVSKNVIPELKFWFPKNRYKTNKRGKHFESEWTTDTGWNFDIMTYEQEPKEFEGVTLGWCLDGDTRVLLNTGEWREIKDLKEGQKVISYGSSRYSELRQPRTQKSKQITKHIYTGKKNVYKIKAAKGFEIEATAEHKFFVNGKGWLQLKDIQVGDRLVTKEHTIQGMSTMKTDLAFLIGAWIGDGWMAKSVFFANKNKLLLKQVEDKVERMTHKSRYDYRIVDKSMREYLIHSGLSTRKAYSKFIPQDIFTGTEKIVRNFLQGLYATDGWFSGRTVGYGTTSQRLAKDLQLLLRRLNITAGVYFKKSQKEGVWRDQWFVLINKTIDVLDFCDSVKVKSKQIQQNKVREKARKIFYSKTKTRDSINTRKSRRLVSIRSIEYAGLRDVYDISVEDNHNFLANGLLTHNCWFDEPPPDKILKATIARMRKGGIIIITATPISGSAHLYDMFAKGEVEVEVTAREGDKPVKVMRNVYHITADVSSACKKCGVRGHLEHKHILQMIAEYPEDERQARVYGKFQHLVGLVYKRFNKEIHVIKPFNITESDFVVYEYLDPHPRNPDALLWMAVDRKGTKYVVDELYVKPDDTKDLATKIKNIAKMYRVNGRWIDPWAFNDDQHKGQDEPNLSDALSKEGLTYLPAPKQRRAADKRIETALSYNEVNKHMIRPPELYIFDHCKRTIWEFEHYRWDEWSGKTGDNRDRKEKPVDKDDHMIENLGRALISEHQFVEAPAKRSSGSISNSDMDPYA